jgi:hypothetical protein
MHVTASAQVSKWHSLPVDGLRARMSVGEGTAAVARPPGARGKVIHNGPQDQWDDHFELSRLTAHR